MVLTLFVVLIVVAVLIVITERMRFVFPKTMKILRHFGNEKNTLMMETSFLLFRSVFYFAAFSFLCCHLCRRCCCCCCLLLEATKGEEQIIYSFSSSSKIRVEGD